MAGKSSIEWTDRTWNPVRGCSMAKGSETGGCLNCYAARMASRNLPEMKSPTTGEAFARILDSGPRWTGKVELIEKALPAPLHWRNPQRIFVNSMSDLFHEALTDEQIDRVFGIMALCPQHTFQILTKRPERMLAYLSRGVDDEFMREQMDEAVQEFGACHANMNQPDRWPLPNVWLGASVENQATADARIPVLLRTPAAKRFVSYEPALGPVSFEKWSDTGLECGGCGWSGVESECKEAGPEDDTGFACPQCSEICGHLPLDERLDQIIVGGESGPGARPFDVQWARNTVQQCASAGVACFVKQLGAKPTEGGKWPDGSPSTYSFHLEDRKGGDMSEWPEDIRVREFPAGVPMSGPRAGDPR